MNDSPDLDLIHDACRNNRHAIEASKRCGCFSCETIFLPWEVTDWTDNDFSAICPRCQIDAVLPDQLSNAVLNQALLRAMRTRWFDQTIAA